MGAYVAQAEVGPLLDEGRAELARLLGVPAAGVAFVQSAEAALVSLLAAWPIQPGDTVAVVPSEWGPNLHAFADRGLRITELATDGDGAADLAALERRLADDPPAAVHLTQVTSHRALLQPVAQAAALCRAAGVPLWVDAAQALGHVDTACGADAIYATSRKWLTGPRGVGVLGVADRWWDRLRISASDLVAGMRPADGQPGLAARGERGQRARVGRPVHGGQGVRGGRARPRVAAAGVGRTADQGGAGRPARLDGGRPGGRRVRDHRAARGVRPGRLRDQGTPAREYGIVTTAGAVTRAPREMTEPLLRISPHVDCTADDLARAGRALLALG